jgi:hypothetical protein
MGNNDNVSRLGCEFQGSSPWQAVRSASEPYSLTPRLTMKSIVFAVLVIALSGCSTPNPNPAATEAAYGRVRVGMTRSQVYALLGPPKSVRPAGDTEHCRTAKWSIPHDSRGWGSWKVTFSADTVTGVDPIVAVASGSYSP